MEKESFLQDGHSAITPVIGSVFIVASHLIAMPYPAFIIYHAVDTLQERMGV